MYYGAMSRKTPEFGKLDLDIYTVTEVSVRLGTKKATIYQAIKDGKLRAIDFGGSSGFRIRKDALLEWLDSRTVHPRAAEE